MRVFLSRRGSEGLKSFVAAGNAMEPPRHGPRGGEEAAKAEGGAPYVIYRHRRLFAAYVARGRKGEAVSDMAAFARRESEDQALLCCTSYCVVRSGRSFMRTLYHRPLEAIALAGLSWKEVPDEEKGKRHLQSWRGRQGRGLRGAVRDNFSP